MRIELDTEMACGNVYAIPLPCTLHFLQVPLFSTHYFDVQGFAWGPLVSLYSCEGVKDHDTVLAQHA